MIIIFDCFCLLECNSWVAKLLTDATSLYSTVYTSDHIVAQQANRYIVAFHIAISYDTQRPGYNGRAVGLRAPCMVLLPWRTVVLYALTSALQRLTAACETH